MFTSRPRARLAPATLAPLAPPVRLALAAAVALAALTVAPALADAPPTVEVTVGDSRPLGGAGARCDDLAVVSVTLGPQAVVTGLRPGRTLCSVAVGGAAGARRVFQVVVLAAAPKAPQPKAGGAEPRPDGR